MLTEQQLSMFEAQVLGLLQRYLGKYVYGLDAESLRISVWRGDVELSNLRLKPEALDELNLPVTVKSGLLGRLRLKVRPAGGGEHLYTTLPPPQQRLAGPGRVGALLPAARLAHQSPAPCSWTLETSAALHPVQVPWSQLGTQPVVAEFDRLYIVASPREDDSDTGSCPQDVEDAIAAAQAVEQAAKQHRIDTAEDTWLKVRERGWGSRACTTDSACCALLFVCLH